MLRNNQKKLFFCTLILTGNLLYAHDKSPVQGSQDSPSIQKEPSKKVAWPWRGSKKSKKRAKPAPEKSKADGQKNGAKDPEKDIYQWFKTYSEVVSLVEKKAFRSVDFSKFIQDSLKSAVSQIDSHSAFFTQESYKAAIESTSGEFSGIGVSIISKAPEDEALVIIDVIQSGPADKAGMKSGDKIVEVNGEKLKGLTSDEVINKLKGKIASKLSLKIIRNKKPLSFEVKRDIIKDQSAQCYYLKNQNIYYVSLKLFTENVAAQVAELLKKANDGKCKGLILDLRRNPGGTLDSAIDMAGLFLPKKSLVTVTKDNEKRVVAEYFTSTEPILKSNAPIFILIDNFTASAAEILAGCLRYHAAKEPKSTAESQKNNLMVFLVGTSTFGKGSVQEVIPVSNGCALKLTTMLYYLPDEISIQAVGIHPDFTIKPKFIPVDEMKWINELYGKETALKHHVTVKEVEKNGGKIAPEDKEKIKKEQEELKKKSSGESEEDGLDDSIESQDSEKPHAKHAKDNKTQDNQDKKEKSWDEKQKEELAGDIQVQASVNMINLLVMTKKTDPQLLNSRQKALAFLKANYLTDDLVEVEKVK